MKPGREGESRSRILVVQKSCDYSHIVVNTLKSLNYEVAWVADSATHAIFATLSHKPDLILMNMELRGSINGVRAAELIRTQSDAPIVFMGHFREWEEFVSTSKRESYEFILKPVHSLRLAAILSRSMRRGKTFSDG